MFSASSNFACQLVYQATKCGKKILPTVPTFQQHIQLVHHMGYTIHHMGYTLHHMEYTLHHMGYTLHHMGYTLHHTNRLNTNRLVAS